MYEILCCIWMRNCLFILLTKMLEIILLLICTLNLVYLFNKPTTVNIAVKHRIFVVLYL